MAPQRLPQADDPGGASTEPVPDCLTDNFTGARKTHSRRNFAKNFSLGDLVAGAKSVVDVGAFQHVRAAQVVYVGQSRTYSNWLFWMSQSYRHGLGMTREAWIDLGYLIDRGADFAMLIAAE